MTTEAQLKRAEVQNERLKEELELCKKIILVSEACDGLVKFVSKTSDPYLNQEPNKWVINPARRAFCIIL